MSSWRRPHLEGRRPRAEAAAQRPRGAQPDRVRLPGDAADVLHAPDHARDPGGGPGRAARLLRLRPSRRQQDVVLPARLCPARGRESHAKLGQRIAHRHRRVGHHEYSSDGRCARLGPSRHRRRSEPDADDECRDPDEHCVTHAHSLAQRYGILGATKEASRPPPSLPPTAATGAAAPVADLLEVSSRR